MLENKKPKVTNSLSERELDKAEKQFEAFDAEIKEMTLDRMNQAPKLEVEPQTKIAQSDLSKMTDVYLKPKRTIRSVEKFNENFRKDYEFDKEYVHFTAENREIIGEDITLWTKPYAGLPAEEWVVPVNKPIWGPRYLAEQLKKSRYHRLVMRDQPIGEDTKAQYYGTMAVDNVIQRLDAHPVNSRRSVFMGVGGF